METRTLLDGITAFSLPLRQQQLNESTSTLSLASYSGWGVNGTTLHLTHEPLPGPRPALPDWVPQLDSAGGGGSSNKVAIGVGVGVGVGGALVVLAVVAAALVVMRNKHRGQNPLISLSDTETG